MCPGLCDRDCEIKVVPWDHDITKEPYDGLFLSNGPGDPEMAATTTEFVRQIVSGEAGVNPNHPIFGICMGNQLLGTAAGAKTYKMPFGNRGQNVPVLNLLTGACTITPQNHGYALDADALPDGWAPLFVNRNDGTNEGIYHKEKPFFSAQFHPESRGGPTDTEHFFDLFVKMSREKAAFGSVGAYFQKISEKRVEKPPMPKKVLMLGSGGLSIGQAGEFDYSGSQAIKALKEERIAGAGLDVYEGEPAVPEELRKLKNVVLLPHLGSATREGRQAMGDKVIINIKTFIDGHRPTDRVLPGIDD